MTPRKKFLTIEERFKRDLPNFKYKTFLRGGCWYTKVWPENATYSLMHEGWTEEQSKQRAFNETLRLVNQQRARRVKENA